MKIVIDTNIFLYAYDLRCADKISNLTKLIKAHDIIWIEQIEDEFHRNRVREIERNLQDVAAKNVFNRMDLGSTNVIKFNKAVKVAQDRYTSFILAPEVNDVVLIQINEIKNKPNSLYIKHSNKDYNTAIKRNKLGNPPTSGNKGGTVCDEYIWEQLLSNASDYIAFITNDETYHENDYFLRKEFREKTGNGINFFRDIKSFYTFLRKEEETNEQIRQINLQKQLVDKLAIQARLKEIEAEIILNSSYFEGGNLNSNANPQSYVMNMGSPRNIGRAGTFLSSAVGTHYIKNIANLKVEYAELLEKLAQK